MLSWIRLIMCLCIVMLLSMIALPPEIRIFRPPFVLLYILYCQFFSEKSLGVSGLFLLGLCVDVCTQSLLGEHAFALVFTLGYASSKSRRFEGSSLSHQLFLIGLFCFIYQLILQIIGLIIGDHQPWWSAPLTGLIGAWFWPLMCFWLGTGRTRFKRAPGQYWH